MCCIRFSEDQIPHGFPTIDMGPQLKVVERTRTATMLCAASGNPDPEIHWLKDFLPVDIGGSNGRIKQLRSGEATLAFWYLGFWSCYWPYWPTSIVPRTYTVYTASGQDAIRGSTYQRFQVIQAANHDG